MNIINKSKVQELIDTGFDIDVTGALSEGIEITKKEIGLFIGFTLVYFMIVMAAGFIPFASQIISPPLIAGYYLVAHKIHRNDFVEFGDFFKGFDYFGQLLVQYLILLGLMLLVCIPLIAALISAGFFANGYISEGQFGIVAILSGILSLIGVLYLSTVYIFAPFFIVFGDYQAWDSMEASRKIVNNNFWIVFGLLLLVGLFIAAGMLLCFVGALFTLPAGYAAFYIAFNRLVDLDKVQGEGQDDILDHLVD